MPIYRPLRPENWPQDKLEVPNGIGQMPPISKGNADLARSEYATFSADFAVPNNQPAGTIQSAFIPTDQDGDFWCNQIGAASWVYIAAAKGATAMVAGNISVRDARTGRSLFYPNSVPLDMFRKFSLYTPVNYTNTLLREPLPSGFRQTGDIIQPFCFTRQGGIQVDITFPNATTVPTGRYDLTIMFSGWKEYTNASQ